MKKIKRPDLFIDQVGYLPESEKIAAFTFPAEDFTVEDVNGRIVYEGKVSHFGWDAQSGDDVYTADLSRLCREGRYVVKAGGRSSSEFSISGRVYDKLFKDAVKAFYYLRCGTELTREYAGAYTHRECHTGRSVIFGTNESVMITGGWHDAGDYGRYVTAGSVAAAHLMYAYLFFPDAFSVSFDIPESVLPVPDILSEIRVELEWLLKMQREDGAAYHKQTTMKHAPFVMPEDDDDQLYIFPVSSYATADLCAVAALGARVYANTDKGFSERLRKAAIKSSDWLEKHKELVGFSNPEGCNTGLYAEFTDTDNRYWAYCELYALTGEEKYYELLKKYYSEHDFEKIALGYISVGGLGALAYSQCEKYDDVIFEKIKRDFIDAAYYLKELSEANGYEAAMAEYDYYWGSNMTLLQHGMIFLIADRFLGEKVFRKYAVKQLDVLLGKNPLGISYVTGNGDHRCNDPHYRPASADGVEECIPGFVCGGPNPRLDDMRAKELIPKGTPPMKCFADDERCYSLNEVTIYWNSPLVFLLAGIVSPDE